MKKIFITAMIFFTASTYIYAEKIITTKNECVYLDELTAAHIAHKEVACNLQPGESKLFTKEMITNYLNREGVQGRVLDDVRVTRAGVELSQEQILEAVGSYFKAAYPNYTFEITQLRMPRDLYAKDIADFTISVDTDKFGSSYVEIGNGSRKINAYIFVKAFANGYVANTKIAEGEPVASKTRPEKIDVTNLRGRVVASLNDMVASKTILQGKPILSDNVNIKPENVKGDTIKLIISNGQIKIQTIGILEENAYKGKTVLVKNKDTQKVISAKYIGNGIAEALF